VTVPTEGHVLAAATQARPLARDAPGRMEHTDGAVPGGESCPGRLRLPDDGCGLPAVAHVAGTSAGRREAYSRPANKRDLGHRCYGCHRPFSTLGVALVLELQGGPAQRFHPECWQRQYKRKPPVLFERRVTDGPGSLASDRRDDVVKAYADEWRRAALDTDGATARRRSRGPALRKSELISMITIEDGSGERTVARGFTQREAEAAMSQWARAEATDEECAICFGCQSRPLHLPCGHHFCSGCVEPWLRRCALCPMCREDLRPRAEVPRAGALRASSAFAPCTEGLGLLIQQHPALRAGSRSPARAPPGAPAAAGLQVLGARRGAQVPESPPSARGVRQGLQTGRAFTMR